MAAAIDWTEQPAPKHIITQSLLLVYFLRLYSPRPECVCRLWPLFWAIWEKGVLFLAPFVLLSPVVKEAARCDQHFSSCLLIGCCVILGAWDNSCCCVDGRATRGEVMIGAQEEDGWRAGRGVVGVGPAATAVVARMSVGTPSVNGVVTLLPPFLGSGRCERVLNMSTPLYYGILLTDALSPQCKWTCMCVCVCVCCHVSAHACCRTWILDA